MLDPSQPIQDTDYSWTNGIFDPAFTLVAKTTIFPTPFVRCGVAAFRDDVEATCGPAARFSVAISIRNASNNWINPIPYIGNIAMSVLFSFSN